MDICSKAFQGRGPRAIVEEAARSAREIASDAARSAARPYAVWGDLCVLTGWIVPMPPRPMRAAEDARTSA